MFILIHCGKRSMDTWNCLEKQNTYPPGLSSGEMLLVGAVIHYNLFISGNNQRQLQAEPLPLEFDNWPQLCTDGIEVHVISLVWMSEPSILTLIEYNIASCGRNSR